MAQKLNFPPEQAGYVVHHAQHVVGIGLKGGASRLRADVVGNTSTVSCSWLFDHGDYQDFMTFMRVSTANGTLPFLINLVIDFGLPATYRCTLVPGTFSTNRVRGLSYQVSMELEVEQPTFFLGTENFHSPNRIVFPATPSPPFTSTFAPGDTLQIIGAGRNNGVNPPVNLDGTYTITSVPNASEIQLFDPASVKPDWALVASYPGGIVQLVNDVVLLKGADLSSFHLPTVMQHGCNSYAPQEQAQAN